MKSIVRTTPKFSLQPIRLRELPTWLLAIAFVVLASSNFQPQWIAQKQAPVCTEEANDPGAVQIILSKLIQRLANATGKAS